jgi:hypothetical protein
MDQHQMKRGYLPLIFLLGLSCLACLTHSAEAYFIPYGDFSATTVDFIGVSETSTTEPEGTALFGRPVVTGTQALFFPSQFVSESSGSMSSDTTAGSLSMTIRAHDGFAIAGISILGIGSASLLGTSRTDVTRATVGGTLTVAGLDPISLTVSPGGGVYTLCDDHGFTSFSTSISVDLSDPGMTEVGFWLENILTTSSEEGTTAKIQQQFLQNGVSMEIYTAPVPLPGAAWLLITGLSAGACLRRFLNK